MSKKVTTTTKLYIGIDIHKRSWKIQMATNDFWGKNFTSPPCSVTLKDYVEKHFKDYEIHVADTKLKEILLLLDGMHLL